MDKERSLELQRRVTREALAMLVIHGEGIEVSNYERAVILIGTTWSLDPKSAVKQLELITREKAALLGAADPEKAQHVLPKNDRPMNASGMETLDDIWDLFETTVQLEDREQRAALFRLASELAESRNLLDWIEKTPEEQELPETAESWSAQPLRSGAAVLFSLCWPRLYPLTGYRDTDIIRDR